jgi:hypothetical protein
VRIFVQFDSLDAAQSATSALNGRFFSGRQILARPYDEVAFYSASFDL